MRILKSLLKSKIYLSILLVFISIEKAIPQNSDDFVIDEIIAKVDNYIVLKSELERAYLEMMSSGQYLGSDGKCQILESLIINKMMVAKAEIDSVIVSNEEVEANLDRRMQIFIAQFGSEEKIEEYYDKSIDELKNDIKDQIHEQLVVQRMQQEITVGVNIRPAEVKKFFKNIPQDSLPFFSAEVTVGQIVKDPIIGKLQKKKVVDQLVDIRQQILDGTSFAEMAKKYSQDPGSASNGGNLGFWKRGELAPEYEATSLSMNVNEISMPVETQFGFHIIQLVERRGNSYSTRHILIKPGSSNEDIKEAEKYLDSLRTLIINEEAIFEKVAKEYSDDIYTAGNGGFFLDATGSAKVSVEELNPKLFFTIDTMKVGTLSKPIRFIKDDGEEAVRIIYYKSRVKPHMANISDDWQKIQAAAINEKKGKAIDKWFNKVKSEVFVEVDEVYKSCELLN